MKEKIKKELSLLPKNYVALVLVGADGFEQANMGLLDILVNDEKLKGCYVTLNRTFTNLKGLLIKNNIGANKLFFIDAISKEVEIVKEYDNCMYMASPESLTELGEAIDGVLKSGKHDFIFIDSINILNIYNDPKTTIKFLHVFTEKIREKNMKGILICLDEEADKKFIDEIAEFCDKIVRL